MSIRTNAKLKSAAITTAKKKIEKSRARALPKPPVQSRSRGIPPRLVGMRECFVGTFGPPVGTLMLDRGSGAHADMLPAASVPLCR